MLREAELEVRGEPLVLERVARSVLFGDDVGEILLHEVRQHETVVQLRSPAREAFGDIRCSPEARDERPKQELLREAHVGVRRHFERAQLEKTESTRRAIG